MEHLKDEVGNTDLENKSLKGSLVMQCNVMLDYALKTGKTVEGYQVAPLEKPIEELHSKELLSVFNYLSVLVKPAIPGTLMLFEKNRQSNSKFKAVGPLPIVRAFMLVTIISLLALIGTSLSPRVNNETMMLSMLQGSGWPQVERLAFLLAAAGVGGSFYALFKMSGYIKEGTFDMKYAATYWSRFVLGLVSGVLLSELFVVFIEDIPVTANTPTDSDAEPLTSAPYLIKPILAILGGFSANLVYRILNRLIDAVESLFKGSTDEQLSHKQTESALANLATENRLRTESASNLLALKQQLMEHDVPQSILEEVDKTITRAMPAGSSIVPAHANSENK